MKKRRLARSNSADQKNDGALSGPHSDFLSKLYLEITPFRVACCFDLCCLRRKLWNEVPNNEIQIFINDMYHVESTLIARDGTWKAEIFRRRNGTYGFRAMRWVAEETCWVEAGRFSESITSSLEAAEFEARTRVPQLGKSAKRVRSTSTEMESDTDA